MLSGCSECPAGVALVSSSKLYRSTGDATVGGDAGGFDTVTPAGDASCDRGEYALLAEGKAFRAAAGKFGSAADSGLADCSLVDERRPGLWLQVVRLPNSEALPPSESAGDVKCKSSAASSQLRVPCKVQSLITK